MRPRVPHRLRQRSPHSSGNAVDIAKINGVPIIGHQGKGSITDDAIQRLLTLQGTMKPDQIISLMTFEGADNTLSMSDHHDHIHVGFRPLYGANTREGRQLNSVLKPDQWIRLVDRLAEVDNPEVSLEPSKYSVKAVRPASEAHTRRVTATSAQGSVPVARAGQGWMTDSTASAAARTWVVDAQRTSTAAG